MTINFHGRDAIVFIVMYSKEVAYLLLPGSLDLVYDLVHSWADVMIYEEVGTIGAETVSSDVVFHEELIPWNIDIIGAEKDEGVPKVRIKIQVALGGRTVLFNKLFYVQCQSHDGHNSDELRTSRGFGEFSNNSEM